MASECRCGVQKCPHCGALLTWQLVTFPASQPGTPQPEPIVEAPAVIAPNPAPLPTVHTPVGSLNVKAETGAVPEAPPVWKLPMKFRTHNPWGYLHRQINHKGQLHPGYDLNNGGSAHADLGEPIYAPRAGIVVYAKRVPGWGTLMCILLDEAVDGERVVVRFGHPDTILAQWGEHVEAGQLVATCGDGKMPGVYTPHLHYDIVRIDPLWTVTQSRGLNKPDVNYYGHGRDPVLFEALYVDPRRFHPEIDSALARVGK